MIIYDKLWELLKRRSISKFRFRISTNIVGDTFDRLKKNKPVSTKTLDAICLTLDCKLEDFAEFVKSEDENI